MVYNKIYAQIGEERHIVLDPINYQYDVKQILVIQGETVPDYYEADVCNVGDTATLTMVGTAADGVEIPDNFLQDGRNVLVYVVIPGSGGDVQTRYDITIPVDERAEREDIDPSEAEQQQIDSLINALNSGVGRAETAAAAAEGSSGDAADYAADAEAWAVGQRDGVDVDTLDPTYHNNSKYYAGIAEAAAEEAGQHEASWESWVRRAETAADDAEGSATAAGQSKTDAEAAAQTATQKANAAASSATEAANSASEAEQTVAGGVGAINTARDGALSAIGQAGTTQTGAVNQAGASQVAAVNQAGATQVQAVEDKGNEVLDSIPQDYSDLVDDVADLTRQISDVESALQQHLYEITYSDMWERKSYNDDNSTTRIRTQCYPFNVKKVKAPSGYKVAFSYIYFVGNTKKFKVYNGSSFADTDLYWADELDVPYEMSNGYFARLYFVNVKADNNATITTDVGASIVFVCRNEHPYRFGFYDTDTGAFSDKRTTITSVNTYSFVSSDYIEYDGKDAFARTDNKLTVIRLSMYDSSKTFLGYLDPIGGSTLSGTKYIALTTVLAENDTDNVAIDVVSSETDLPNVKEVSLGNSFVNKTFGSNGIMSTNNSKRLSTANPVFVGVGNYYKIVCRKGWTASVNYYSHPLDPTANARATYEDGYVGTSVFKARYPYIVVVYKKVDEDGNEVDLSSTAKPESSVFIIGNGNLDPQDFGAIYDGTTDCTSAFQSALNYGQLVVDIEGVALCGTLYVNQDNTLIKFTNKFTVKLKNNTNAPLFATYGTAYTNTSDLVGYDAIENVVVSGGIFDGNGANQTYTEPTEENPFSIGIYSLLFLLDINGLMISDITVKNPMKFGCAIGNIKRFTINNVYCDYYGRNAANMDGIHCYGALEYGEISNVFGITRDDMVAINIDGDYNYVVGTMPRRGNARHIVIRNIFPDGAYRAVRLLCGTDYTTDDIVIDGVHGSTTQKSAIHISNWNGAASHGRIAIRNVDVRCPECVVQVGEDSPSYNYQTTVESLILDGVTVNPSADENEGIINMYNSSSISNLILKDVVVSSDNDPITPLIKGAIGTAICSDINLQNANLTLFGATVTTLLSSNVILSGGSLYANAPTTHQESNVV